MQDEVVDVATFNPLGQVQQLSLVVQMRAPIVNPVEVFLEIFPEHARGQQGKPHGIQIDTVINHSP